MIKKILDKADFANKETCSFTRLNDAFWKTLLKAAKRTLKQPTMRFQIVTQRIVGSYEKRFFWGGGRGGVRLIVNEKLMIGYLLQHIFSKYSVRRRIK